MVRARFLLRGRFRKVVPQTPIHPKTRTQENSALFQDMPQRSLRDVNEGSELTKSIGLRCCGDNCLPQITPSQQNNLILWKLQDDEILADYFRILYPFLFSSMLGVD